MEQLMGARALYAIIRLGWRGLPGTKSLAYFTSSDTNERKVIKHWHCIIVACMIVNYDSSIINKYGASLTDDARVVIYNNQLFIVQATSVSAMKHFVIAEKATIS